MFDDLRRNFLMNPQNGLKVNVFIYSLAMLESESQQGLEDADSIIHANMLKLGALTSYMYVLDL